MLGLEVQIPPSARAPSTPAYAVLPPGARRGLVVLHEMYGRQPEMDRVCERLGDDGFAAVQPDLFDRSLRPICIAGIMRAVSRGEGVAIDQIVAARDWLASTVKIPLDKIGVIGFCMGAGLAFAVGKSFAAVSGNYGMVPPEPVLAGSGPVIGCFGMRDRMFRKQADVLDERLTKLGVRHEVHKFDAGHSFLTDGKHPIAELFTQPFLALGGPPSAAEDGWKKILRFFDAELGFR